MLLSASSFFMSMWALAVLYHWRKFGREISIMPILSALVILLHGIPLLVYLEITGPDTQIYEAALRGTNHEEIQATLLTAMSLMYLFLILGSELAQRVFRNWYRFGQAASRAAQGETLYRAYEWTQRSYNVLWAVVLFMLAVSLFQSQPLKVYHYFASGGSEFEKIALRREFGGTNIYLYNVLLYSIAPFLVMVVYSANSAGRKAKWRWWLFWGLFAVTLLGKFGTLSKAPPVVFLIQFFFFRMLLKRQTFNIRALAWMSILVFGLFTLIVSITMPELDLSGVMQFLYYRMFDIPNEGLLEFFAAIPSQIPHSWGWGLFGFMEYFSDEKIVPTYFAVAAVTRGSLDSSSNVMFVGDAWAQFSWAGVVVFSVLAGFVVRSIDLFASRHGHSDEYASVVAACAFGVFTMLSTSLTTALITGGLAIIPFLSFFFSSKEKRRVLRGSTLAASSERR